MTGRPCDWCARPLPPDRKHIHEECVFPEIEAILAGQLPFVRKVAPPRADPHAAEKRAAIRAKMAAGRAVLAALPDDELRALFDAGLSDGAISDRIGVTYKAIKLRRARLAPRRARAA